MKTRILMIAAVLAFSASAAHAGKLSAVEKKAMAQKIADNQRNFKQPTTSAQALATRVKLADGTVAALVPTELWSNLAATTDAQGNTIILESEGSAPVVTGNEGLSNE